MIKLTIPGEPLPCARPRVTTRCGYAQTYDPQAKIKSALTATAHMEWSKNGQSNAFAGPLAVELTFYMTVPTSQSTKSRHARLWRFPGYEHQSRPDLDNLEKTICDVLTGIAWQDDRQIIELKSKKLYDWNPRTEVKIVPIETKELDPTTAEILQIMGPEQALHLAKAVYHLATEMRLLDETDEPAMRAYHMASAAKVLSLIADTHCKSLTKISKTFPGHHIGSQHE